MKNWHSFKALGRFFLFDVQSNSLFNIDELIYNYLNNIPVPENKMAQVCADLDELKAAGYMTEEEDTQLQLVRDASLKALCLHISHNCNLKCKYCFAKSGSFGGKRENMSFEVGQKAIDFLLRESGKRRQLEVDFFGGEPLINFEVVKQVVGYGRGEAARLGKEINFTLTTNGIELNKPVRDFLNEERISVVLSLDGRPEVNDRMRGEGSYQRALPNILELVKNRNHRNYYLRGTYTANNTDFLEDVKHLYDLGLRELSLEPVVDAHGDYRLTEMHLAELEREYDKLAEFYFDKYESGEAFTFFHFEISLEKGPCLAKRLTGCGAGYDYFAVTPTGELYPCHQFVGRKDFMMGDLESGIFRDNLRQKFGMATLYKKKGCWNCWSRFYCSGGCHANAHLINGSIYKPDPIGCRLQQKRLECALALKGLLTQKEAKISNA